MSVEMKPLNAPSYMSERNMITPESRATATTFMKGGGISNDASFRYITIALMAGIGVFMLALWAGAYWAVWNGAIAPSLQFTSTIYQPSTTVDSTKTSFYQVYQGGFVKLDLSTATPDTTSADLRQSFPTQTLARCPTPYGSGWSDIISVTTNLILQYSTSTGFYMLELAGSLREVIPAKLVIGTDSLLILATYIILAIMVGLLGYATSSQNANLSILSAGEAGPWIDTFLEISWLVFGLLASTLSVLVILAMQGQNTFQVYFVTTGAIILLELMRYVLQQYVTSAEYFKGKVANRKHMQLGWVVCMLNTAYSCSVLVMFLWLVIKSYNYGRNGNLLEWDTVTGNFVPGLPSLTRSTIWVFVGMYFLGTIIVNYFDLAVRLSAILAQSRKNLEYGGVGNAANQYNSFDQSINAYSWSMATFYGCFNKFSLEQLERAKRIILIVMIVYINATFFSYGVMVAAGVANMPVGLTCSFATQ